MSYTRRSFIRDASMTMLCGTTLFAGGACSGPPATGARRALSLGVLQDKLANRTAMAGERSVIENLAGITRLQGFAIDADSGDTVLFGRADPTWPALKLEDFVVALRNAFHHYVEREGNTVLYAYPGCSIDPDSAALTRMQVTSNQVRDLVSNGEEDNARDVWLEACRSPQQVRIFGMPESNFANVCVVADYRMKALCDGSIELGLQNFDSLTEKRATRVSAALRNNNYSSEAAKMNRFWFTPGQQRFHVDEGIALVAECSIALKTEQSVLNEQDRSEREHVDVEAEQWAQNFTQNYGDIAVAEGSGVYLQLQQLFDHVAVAKLMARNCMERGYGGLKELLDDFSIPTVGVPKALEGRGNLVTVKHVSHAAAQTRTQLVTLQVCGGVGVDIDISDENLVNDGGHLDSLRSNVISARPVENRLWWDVSGSAVLG